MEMPFLFFFNSMVLIIIGILDVFATKLSVKNIYIFKNKINNKSAL